MIKGLIRYSKSINLPLLAFLVLFLDVKFVVKLAGLIFIILYSKDFKLGLKWKNSRLPLFYALIIALEAVKYLVITRDYSFRYLLVFSLGILQWIMSLLAMHNIKLMVEKDSTERIHDTIKVFYVINFTISIIFLYLLLFFPSLLRFWGQGTGLYFSHASAGDAILGITFDASTVNATINCFGLIYFLYKKEYIFCLVNILIIVLCTSNITYAFTMVLLVLMVLSVKSRRLRLATIASCLTLTILYIAISPKNREYVRTYFVQLYIVNKMQAMENDSEMVAVEGKNGIEYVKRRVKLSNDSLYSFSNKKLKMSLANIFSLRDFKEDKDSGYLIIPYEVYDSRPGKLISFIQTLFYLDQNPKNLLFGAGVGNFSSKLAFRASGVHALGTYPEKFEYTSPEFRHSHLQTYLSYSHMDASKHSILNYPFSVYNQILGEYGLIGFILFAVFYIGFFALRYKKLSYGRYLTLGLLGFFIMEYWFEFFSLVILFELFMFLNMKESEQLNNPNSQKITGQES